MVGRSACMHRRVTPDPGPRHLVLNPQQRVAPPLGLAGFIILHVMPHLAEARQRREGLVLSEVLALSRHVSPMGMG